MVKMKPFLESSFCLINNNCSLQTPKTVKNLCTVTAWKLLTGYGLRNEEYAVEREVVFDIRKFTFLGSSFCLCRYERCL